MSKVIELLVLSAAVAFAQKPLAIPAGTPVRLAFGESISSAALRPGDKVALRVIEGVVVDGVEVIATGTPLTAIVSLVRPFKSGGKGGIIEMKLVGHTLPSGTRIALTARQAARPAVPVMMAGAVAVSLTPQQGSPFRIATAGSDAVATSGSEIVALTASDVTLDVSKLTPRAGMPPGMTNAAVIDLWRSGGGEDAVIAAVKSAVANFQLDAAGIAELKRAGLTSAVIEAMMAAARGSK